MIVFEPMRTCCILLLTVFISVASSAQDTWTLQRCIDHAFQYNLTIRQGNLNVELTEEVKKNALGNMLPNLNASASHGYNWGQTIDPFTNQFATERIRSNSFGASTNMNLFSGFRLQNALKQSSVDVQSGKYDLEQVQNTLALNVAGAFLSVLQSQELQVIAQTNFDNTVVQVARIQKLVAGGQLAEGNLSEIEAQQANDEASLVAATNNLGLAELNLMQLIQLSDEEMRTFRISSPTDDPESLQLLTDAQAAIESALTNFPQIKSAESRWISATYGEKIAKGFAYPSLGVSFQYGTGYSGASRIPVGDPILGDPYAIGYVGDTFQPVFTVPFSYAYDRKPFSDQLNDNINQSLFFSLQIPIFNGFSTRTNIQRARITREIASITLEQTRQQLTQEVQRAFADAQAAKSNYDAGKTALKASEKAFGYAQTRYEQGMINNTEYADARARVDNARTNLARNKYEYLFRAKILEFYQGRAITFR